jgi:hypothetical protein
MKYEGSKQTICIKSRRLCDSYIWKKNPYIVLLELALWKNACLIRNPTQEDITASGMVHYIFFVVAGIRKTNVLMIIQQLHAPAYVDITIKLDFLSNQMKTILQWYCTCYEANACGGLTAISGIDVLQKIDTLILARINGRLICLIYILNQMPVFISPFLHLVANGFFFDVPQTDPIVVVAYKRMVTN